MSAIPSYLQHTGVMQFVPASQVLKLFELAYAVELTGDIPARFDCFDAEEATQRVAQKIFQYHFLKYLTEVDDKALFSVIGRFYYLPSESYRFRNISRIEAAIVTIPNIGACFVSLIQSGTVTITRSSDEKMISYPFSTSPIVIHPLENIENINLWFSSGTRFDITKEQFPLDYEKVVPCDLSKRNEEISSLSTEILKKSKSFIKSLKQPDSSLGRLKLLNLLKDALKKTHFLGSWIRSEGDFDTEEDITDED